MGGELDGRHKNNPPKDEELNGRHGNNSPQRMNDTKIARQRDGRMETTKVTHLRMENQMTGTKITRPRVGQYKNNSLKGWVAQK